MDVGKWSEEQEHSLTADMDNVPPSGNMLVAGLEAAVTGGSSSLGISGNHSLTVVAQLSLLISRARLWKQMNGTNEWPITPTPPVFPLDYRIFATILHTIIFIVGVTGNILVVVVVRRTKSMHVPTYCYLESLAVADLTVIWSSIPEALVSYQLYASQWILGQAGCSLLIFLSFLGINASSFSILAFTVERFIAICQPLRAKSICTLKRAKKIIVVLWFVALISALPWLGLTVIRPNSTYSGIYHCSFRISRESYVYIFGADFLLFYVIPLLTASILYLKIGLALRKRTSSTEPCTNGTNGNSHSNYAKPNQSSNDRKHLLLRNEYGGSIKGSSVLIGNSMRSASTTSVRSARVKVVRMLFVIVVLFAVLWLPYRGLMLFNATAKRPYQEKWFMLFARTCIFLNSSINPILYNAMSKRFRKAFLAVLSGNQKKRFSQSTRYSPSPSPSLIEPTRSPGRDLRKFHYGTVRHHNKKSARLEISDVPLTTRRSTLVPPDEPRVPLRQVRINLRATPNHRHSR